jgi:hypothetical protein
MTRCLRYNAQAMSRYDELRRMRETRFATKAVTDKSRTCDEKCNNKSPRDNKSNPYSRYHQTPRWRSRASLGAADLQQAKLCPAQKEPAPTASEKQH